MAENIDWYSGNDIYILTVDVPGLVEFNTAFSNELKRNVSKDSMTMYPKVAFALQEGNLLIKIMDNEGLNLKWDIAHGNAALGRSEGFAFLAKFDSEILGEWTFEKVNGYYKGTKTYCDDE